MFSGRNTIVRVVKGLRGVKGHFSKLVSTRYTYTVVRGVKGLRGVKGHFSKKFFEVLKLFK